MAGLDQLAQAAVVIGSAARRAERVGEDGHAAAADQAVVPAVIVVEAEGEHLRPAAVARPSDAEGTLLDLGLDAAAAEGAALAAVGEDEHGGPGLLRRRAARLDHAQKTHGRPLVQRRRQFREDVAHGASRLLEWSRHFRIPCHHLTRADAQRNPSAASLEPPAPVGHLRAATRRGSG